MGEPYSTDFLSLEERLARLEKSIGASAPVGKTTSKLFLVAMPLCGAAVILSYYALDLPNHSYQVILAALTVFLAYHRGYFRLPSRVPHWMLAVANVGIFSLLYKILIGSGMRAPFFWLQYPIMKNQAEQGKWIPNWELVWQPSELANWTVDLTAVQMFLLLLTLIAGLFRFSLFASLTAFVLLICSLPSLVEFDWQWVFPAFLVSSIALYVQVPPRFPS